MTEAPTVGEVVRQRIQDVRERRRWSHRELGERLLELDGVRTPTAKEINGARMNAYRMETGARPVTVDGLFKFAAALGCSPAALLPRSGPVQFAEALTLPAELIHYWMIGTGSLRPEDAYIYDRTWWGGSTLPPDDELLGYAREPNAQEALLGFIEVERLRTSEELDIYRRVSRRATEPEEVQLFQIAIEVREKNLASLDELSRKIKAVKPRRPVQRRKKKEGKNG